MCSFAPPRFPCRFLADRGVRACHVDGDTRPADRTAALRGLKAGLVDVVSSVGVLSEGFDEPAVSCVVLLRPTTSRGLYIQQVGRGLRCRAAVTAAVTGETQAGAFDEPLRAGGIRALCTRARPGELSSGDDDAAEDTEDELRLRAAAAEALAEKTACVVIDMVGNVGRFGAVLGPGPSCEWEVSVTDSRVQSGLASGLACGDDKGPSGGGECGGGGGSSGGAQALKALKRPRPPLARCGGCSAVFHQRAARCLGCGARVENSSAAARRGALKDLRAFRAADNAGANANVNAAGNAVPFGGSGSKGLPRAAPEPKGCDAHRAGVGHRADSGYQTRDDQYRAGGARGDSSPPAEPPVKPCPTGSCGLVGKRGLGSSGASSVGALHPPPPPVAAVTRPPLPLSLLLRRDLPR